MPFTLFEPSPAYPQTVGHGRGGAGNRTKARPASPSSTKLSPPFKTQYHDSRPTSSSPSTYRTSSATPAYSIPSALSATITSTTARNSNDSNNNNNNRSAPYRAIPSYYSTGRGGIGNMYTAGEERAMFRFDEELEREGRRANVPVYHIGRGGEGNLVKGVERRRALAESGGNVGGGHLGREGKGGFDWDVGMPRRV